MTIVAKMNDRLVEIVKVVDEVKFSNTRGWVMICMDFEKTYRKRTEFKWVPAATRFEWVKEFCFS